MYNLKYIVCIHFPSNSSIFPEITLEFSGCANVHWSEHKTGKKGERKRREHYRAREEYFNQSIVLVQKGRLKPIFGTILLLIAHQNLSLYNINTFNVFFQFKSINYDTCNDHVQLWNQTSFVGQEDHVIKRGFYEYPFSFELPQNLPSSYESRIGHVRYKLKANIDRPWAFDNSSELYISVVAPFDLNKHQDAHVSY